MNDQVVTINRAESVIPSFAFPVIIFALPVCGVSSRQMGW